MSGSQPQNFVSQNGVGVISDANLNAAVQTDPTVAVLRTFVGIAGMAVLIQGITAPGDGGAGLFYWNAGSYTDDGMSTIVPPAATGQGAWLRSASLYPVPKYTVTGLPAVGPPNQGQVAYATNGRNTGQSAGAGTGCLVSVSSAGAWCAVWSGVPVTA